MTTRPGGEICLHQASKDNFNDVKEDLSVAVDNGQEVRKR